MSRILLADDSAHAQRMGECILREEGFEVVSVTDGDTAIFRLADVDPDVILADVLLPRRNGYEICRYVKQTPRFRHTRVVLTAGALEPLDEDEARRVEADASLRKPFEASSVLETIKPLVAAAELARAESAPPPDVVEVPEPEATAAAADAAGPAPDRELVKAAVTLALEAATPAMIDEITARVLDSFQTQLLFLHLEREKNKSG